MAKSYHTLPAVIPDADLRHQPQVINGYVSAPIPTVTVPSRHNPSPTSPPGLSRPLTLGTLYQAFRRCWKIALPVGLILGVSAGVAAWILRPDKATSTATLRVASASATRLLQDGNGPNEADQAYMRTQLALIRNRAVLRDAVQTDAIRQLPAVKRLPDPLSWLDRDLNVQQVEGTELVKLTLTTRGDSSDLAAVLNAVIASYLSTLDKSERAAQYSHLAELKKLFDTYSEKASKLLESMADSANKVNGQDAKVLTLQQQRLVDEYSGEKEDLSSTLSRVREMELQLLGYREQLRNAQASENAAADVLIERDVDLDPLVIAQQKKVNELKEALTVTGERVVDPNHPTIQKARQDLEAADRTLKSIRTDRRVELSQRYKNANKAQAEQAIRECEAKIQLLKTHVTEIEKRVEKAKSEMNNLGINAAELEKNRSELERTNTFLKTIFDQKVRLEAELSSPNRQRVTIVSDAEEAAVLNRNGRAQEAAGAGLVGLLLGLVGISFWEARKGRIYQLSDVTTGLRLPVVGTLPSLEVTTLKESLRLSGGPCDFHSDQGLAESIDAVRTRILNTRFGTTCPVIMVTSAMSGEGKTTVVTQLALSLARAGYRTLLVDCDLRCPKLHRMFDVPLAPGFCEHLDGTADSEAVIHRLETIGLDVLTAGTFDAKAAAGIARKQVNELLVGLRTRYDFILLDSSPLLLVPDGFMVGRYVDGVVFSVRPGVSQVADVYAGYENMCENRMPFVGVVVNGVSRKGMYMSGYESKSLVE